ncbi:MAG: phage holin family protein [Deltaproteobacteria bacterium]|nr:phage holin family protein [Deltaproteobacteria bacterium]
MTQYACRVPARAVPPHHTHARHPRRGVCRPLLGLLNIFIKPVIMLLTLPITIVTLGLFTLVINASLFYLVGSVVEGFDVAGFFTALAGSLIISVLSIILNRFARPGRP